jgi:hypothetical protein
MHLPIGVIEEGEVDPTAKIVPTAEWISPYSDLTAEEQSEIMATVEPPTTPEVQE